MEKSGFFCLLLITLSALVLGGCGDQSNANTQEDDEPTAIPVEASLAALGPIDAIYQGSALLEASEEALVVAEVAGVVREILVETGDRVEAGQALARLDSDRLQLELARARADRDKLASELKRRESMLARNLVSADEVEQLRFEHAQAQAVYELARLNLRESTLVAPIAGVIAERHIKTGNMIAVHGAAFRISRLDQLEAVVHVPERRMAELKAGQEADLRVDAWAAERFTARVERIHPVVDAATGTVKVTLRVADEGGRLRPGMFARVAIRYDHRASALLIPRDAVITEDAQTSVFVIDQGKVSRRAVQLGYAAAGQVEVVAGLDVGEQVVTTGQNTLRDGSLVEVVGAQPAAPAEAPAGAT